MKTYLKKLVTLIMIIVAGMALTLVSCKKSSNESDSLIPFNKPHVINASDKVSIRTSDVANERNFFVRKIELIDRVTNRVVDTYIINVKSSDSNQDIYSALQKRTFSGYLSIESGNYQLLKIEASNGKVANTIEEVQSLNQSESSIKRSELPNTCKLSLIHKCVGKKIDDMNVFSYALCLATAPACYGEVWAECSFIYCVTGEQNVKSI